MSSPYEKQLISEFNEKLKAYLSRPKVKNRLIRTGTLHKEIRKFAKRHDKKYLTDFHDVLKGVKDEVSGPYNK